MKGLVRTNLYWLALVLLAWGSVGCESVPQKKVATLKVMVSSVSAAPLAKLSDLRSYAFLPIQSDEPLVEQKVQQQLAKELEKRGWRKDRAQPDVLISSSHSSSPVEELVPGKKEKESYFDNGSTKVVTRYNNGVAYTTLQSSPAGWKTRVVQTAPSERTVFLKKVVITFYEPVSPASGASPQPSQAALWEGTGMNQSGNANVLSVSSTLIREILREFPQKSGLPETRTVER